MNKSEYDRFLNTPPLWEKRQFDIQQFEFPSLELNQFEPKPIPTNIRLGHRMEYVFKQLVEYSENYQVVLYNLPVRQEKETLGEIDFILKDKIKDKLIHVELTYKFYIIDPEISDPIHRLIGPNKRDKFFTKMEKIKNKQFSLLHSEQGSKALNDKNIDHLKLEHQCCFKAQLFQPFGDRIANLGVLNKDCLVGYWLRFEDFIKPEFTTAQFYMPTKLEWILEPNNEVKWKSHSEIINDIMLLKEYAPMIWLKNHNNEYEKIFVVWW